MEGPGIQVAPRTSKSGSAPPRTPPHLCSCHPRTTNTSPSSLTNAPVNTKTCIQLWLCPSRSNRPGNRRSRIRDAYIAEPEKLITASPKNDASPILPSISSHPHSRSPWAMGTDRLAPRKAYIRNRTKRYDSRRNFGRRVKTPQPMATAVSRAKYEFRVACSW